MKRNKLLFPLSIIIVSLSLTTFIVVHQKNAAAVAIPMGDSPDECGERGGRWINDRGSVDSGGYCEEPDPSNEGCPPSTRPKWVEEERYCIPAGGWEAKNDWCNENGWGWYEPGIKRCSAEDIPLEECREKCFMAFPQFEETQCTELCGGEVEKCTPEIIALCEAQEMTCDPDTGECINIPRK
jgi:hypothetical protein